MNPDNNQHSPNENLRLGSFVDGIAMLLAVLQQPLQLREQSKDGGESSTVAFDGM